MDVFCADDPQLRRFFQTATIGSSGQLVHPKFNPLPMSPNTSFYSAGGCGDCTCQTRRRTTGLPVLFEGTEGINDDGDHGQLSSSITNLPTHIYASTSTITATAGGGSSFASRCSTWDSSTKAKPKRQSQQQQQVPAPQCTCGIHNNNTDSNYDRLSASGTLKSLQRRNSPSVSRLEQQHTCGSMQPPEPQQHHHSSSQHLSASSRIASFFAKRSFRAPNNPLKRTKSVTKLDQRKSLNGNCCNGNGLAAAAAAAADPASDLMESAPKKSFLGLHAPHLQASRITRSHESIVAACRTGNGNATDSNNNNNNRIMSDGSVPVPMQYVGVDNEWKYYDFLRSEEKENAGPGAPRCSKMFENAAPAAAAPLRRTDHVLKIWLQEAKGLPSKKRYYCEVYLDQNLYARTSAKTKQDLCFWGEQFEFTKLPVIQTLEVHLYREADSKKRKKDKNQLIGKVVAPISAVSGGAVTERWYPVILERNSGVKSDDAAIRIKARHQIIHVLPLEKYHDLVDYTKLNYSQLCRFLEPRIGIKAKEELATTLVHIMHKLGLSSVFLVDIVMDELNVLDDCHLTFRGNSMATKSMEAYLKLAGGRYLHEALGDLIRALMEAEEDCEVDPGKLGPEVSLQKQQETLMMIVEMTWNKIMNSARYFPAEMREVFQTLRERLTAAGRGELADTLISGCIFLRFLCPAILSPSLFGLIQEYPSQKIARNLTLIAKTVQTLANAAKFNGKESYMEFMNTFVERELPSMRNFLNQISSPMPMNLSGAECNDDHVDLGRELSSLHTLLRESLLQSNMMPQHRATLQPLPDILDGLSVQLAMSMRAAPPPSESIYQTTYLSREVQEQLLARLQNMHSNCKDCQQCAVVQQQQHQSTTFHHTGARQGRPSSGSLPNNNYLLGSSQRPARNLQTNDDYVLFSAIDDDNHHRGSVHSIPASSMMQHHQHHHHRDAKSNSSSPHGSLRLPGEPQQQQQQRHDTNEKARKSPVKLAINGDYVDLIRLGREDHGSLTSISQLSSGYQSSSLQANNQPTSQSCSPVEISTDNVSPNNTGSYSNHPSNRQPSHHSSRTRLSSSSDSAASSMSTPPRDRRNYSAVAPRTNPHYSQNGNAAAAGAPGSNATPPSPKLGTRAFGDTEKRKLKNKQQLSRRTSSPLADRVPVQPTTALSQEDSSGNDRETKQYELEIDQLRGQLAYLQVKLQEAERKLCDQEQTTEKVILDWKCQIEAGEERVKKEQIEKDLQMKSIVVRLITVEEDLRREQAELLGMMRAKQKVIESQEKKIDNLNVANQRLVATLAQLKENSPMRTRNGSVTGRTSPYPAVNNGNRDSRILEHPMDGLSFLNLPESKELRSSSC